MNTNFTPGPWHVKDNGLIYILPPDKSGNLVVAGCGQTYDVSDWEKERSLANAALIAAAPEMYTVLQHFADLINRANAGSETDDLRIFEDVVLIEQVLKKARGEE